MRVSEQYVAFPERVVTHAYGTQQHLSRSIDLLALVAELRRAKELATDYVELPLASKGRLSTRSWALVAPESLRQRYAFWTPA